jgi:hypothetical protein
MKCLALLLLLLAGCTSRESASIEPSLKDSIQGPWWSDTSDPSATYDFRGDTLMLVDQLMEMPYSLESNWITYLYGSDTLRYQVEMHGPDTLMFVKGTYIERPEKLFRWNNADEDSIREASN